MQLKCKHCNTIYTLPDSGLSGEKVCFDVMRVVSDPFMEDEQVWFWSKKEHRLYLNLSGKSVLDMIFLKSGQNVSTKGLIQDLNVHVRWKCEACGEITEINARIPCLINEETKIKLMRVS